MGKLVLCLLILVLHNICVSCENPMEHAMDVFRRAFNERMLSRQEEKSATDGKDIQPLCIRDTSRSRGLVAPCGENNRFPACFHTPTGHVHECKARASPNVISLCFLPAVNQRVVVGCNDSSVNLCPLVNSNPLFLDFCKRSGVNICLGEGNTFQPCANVRIRRSDSEPQWPQLDVDGYYASCENCNLVIRMELDEESNEQPIIEIRSEPLEEGEKIQN